jgi:UDP-glucose 4-epimerase
MDNSRENLVRIVINKLKDGQPPVIFGVDDQTPDGTCIRDYVDVRDIARAHLKVAESQISLPRALNIGTGSGTSVLGVINIIAQENDLDITPIVSDRRQGDPAQFCADISLAEGSLNFFSQYSLRESITSLSQ